MLDIVTHIAGKLELGKEAVRNSLNLLDEGASIPFISRYRKENTGGLNETQLASIADLYEELKGLEKRKESILQTIEGIDMGIFLKAVQNLSANPVSRAIGQDELWVGCFQIDQLPIQSVIVCIRNTGIVQAVIFIRIAIQ